MVSARHPPSFILQRGLVGIGLSAPASALTGVAAAVVAVVGAFALRQALSPWLIGAQFITFFPAVILATLLFGTIPGLVAIAAAATASTFVSMPSHSTAQQWSGTLMFVFVALLDVMIISTLLATNAALKRSLGHIGELNSHLRASETRFRDLLETAPDAMVIADRGERIVLVNAEAERMFGYPREDLVGQPITRLMPEEFRTGHQGRIAAFLAKPQLRRMGYGRNLFGLRKDGSRFPIETNLNVLPGSEGGLISSVIRDITVRRDAEERQALLIRELNHRVKNTLASVQAIVHQTLRTAKDPAAFTDAFTARLAALSQSHDVLTRNDWAGALVSDIAVEQLSPYGRGVEGRFRLSGPDVTLSPNRAVTLGMVMGELATNAAKYGALSDGGTVEVTWSPHDVEQAKWLRLVWTERGGPPVRAPDTQGFGTRLIERSVQGLGGVARMGFNAGGISCEIDFPLLKSEM